MSDFLFGIGRYFLVGFGVLGAIFAYLYFCGLVFKFWPRVGLALAAVVFAGVAALLCGVSVTAFLGPRIGMIAMVPAYVVSLIGWVVYALKKTPVETAPITRRSFLPENKGER